MNARQMDFYCRTINLLWLDLEKRARPTVERLEATGDTACLALAGAINEGIEAFHQKLCAVGVAQSKLRQAQALADAGKQQQADESMSERKPDCEVFFMQERGYWDAQRWAIGHELPYRQDIFGRISALQGTEVIRGGRGGIPAVLQLWFAQGQGGPQC